jgi:HrpA-like RNA helicase
MYLTRAISPPKTAAMENAWSTLQELGAIDQEGNLTALGRHMVGFERDIFMFNLFLSDCLIVITSSRPQASQGMFSRS